MSKEEVNSIQKKGVTASLGDVMMILFGLATLVSMCIALVPVWRAAIRIDANFDSLDDNIKAIAELIPALSVAVVVLCVCVIVLYLMYSRNIRSLYERIQNLPQEIKILNKQLSYHKILLSANAEAAHSVVHHHRYLILKIDEFIRSVDEIDEENLQVAFDRMFECCKEFFLHLSTNIASVFTNMTKDPCAVTIKLINNNLIKTYYRDPISCRRRRAADSINGKEVIHEAKDNTAYLEVIGERRKAFFVRDDLDGMRGYINTGPNFKNEYYNATLVVPVRAREVFSKDKSKYHVIALLCLDNKMGGFAYVEVVELASMYGDLLYDVMCKINYISCKALERGVSHDEVQKWSYWG